jgi:patatin-like phospholipase/acyl hydrolase
MIEMPSAEASFNILSLDGGGIRGIIPAQVLTELEAHLEQSGEKKNLHEHFHLICGTSTGAILAVGIALGVPAKELLRFYNEFASSIFPRWIWNLDKLKTVYRPLYSNKRLLSALHNVYATATGGKTALIHDAKAKLCIPAFNGGTGEINVIKTKHHPDYSRDYKMPAHHAALSSASAPIYFPPHSFNFANQLGEGSNLNMIDGGIFANNPALIGVFEATEKLKLGFGNIKILSIGTGQGKHILKRRWKPPSFRFWLLPNPRLFDIILDSQSQITEQYISFLNRALAHKGQQMIYKRVQYEFSDRPIPLNTSKRNDLERLGIIGQELAKKNLAQIYETFIKNK